MIYASIPRWSPPPRSYKKAKPRPCIIPATVLSEVAERFTKGMHKHPGPESDPERGWRGDACSDEDIRNAMFRHLLAYLSGEASDEDGSHLVAIVCNAIMLRDREVIRGN